jgi:hypothetical protein
MFTQPNQPQRNAAPWRPGLGSRPKWFAVMALGLAPLAAFADHGSTYGHAEITVGFPNGEITLGKTWETGSRTVVVSEERHDECDRNRDDRPVVIERRVEEPQRVVIVEQRRPDVIVVQQRQPEVVVVERPRCEPQRQVVVVRETPRYDRVVYVAPQRRVTVIHREAHGYGRRDYGNQGHESRRYENRGDRGPSYESHGSDSRNNGPRDLFPSSSPRPMRERGVQHSRFTRRPFRGRLLCNTHHV